jgi:hypothetical protein
MKAAGVFTMVSLLAGSPLADRPVLKTFQHKTTGDSIQMQFGFGDGPKPRYRVRACNELTEKPCLHVEFSNVLFQESSMKNRPDWIEKEDRVDTSILDFRISLTQPTPWKFSWEGKALRVDILDRVPKKKTWMNPWMLGGFGAGLVAGGVAIWLGSEAPGATSPSSNIIPPPDVELPK